MDFFYLTLSPFENWHSKKNILKKCHGIKIAETIGFKPQAGLY
jgi:hypothetical protein